MRPASRIAARIDRREGHDAVCVGFLLYAYYGGELPATWQISHAGYGVPRIVGQTYMGLQGIFGVPLDVAATYIVLFTLYGAVLEYSGAGKFFLDISLAATGRRLRRDERPGRQAAAARRRGDQARQGP